jgi:hypothetical protein
VDKNWKQETKTRRFNWIQFCCEKKLGRMLGSGQGESGVFFVGTKGATCGKLMTKLMFVYYWEEILQMQAVPRGSFIYTLWSAPKSLIWHNFVAHFAWGPTQTWPICFRGHWTLTTQKWFLCCRLIRRLVPQFSHSLSQFNPNWMHFGDDQYIFFFLKKKKKKNPVGLEWKHWIQARAKSFSWPCWPKIG